MIKEMFPSYKSDALCIQGRDKCKNRPLLSNMWLRRHHFFVESQNKTKLNFAKIRWAAKTFYLTRDLHMGLNIDHARLQRNFSILVLPTATVCWVCPSTPTRCVRESQSQFDILSCWIVYMHSEGLKRFLFSSHASQHESQRPAWEVRKQQLLVCKMLAAEANF